MPRANRYFLPGHVWHITHRCHQRQFLLKFARDRRRYLRWVFEAKKRFGLSVLNFIVTSNHVHLLVKDTGQHVISQSMQLIAGRTAQEYNQRKGRQGAFWEDRYHATAIEVDEHLHRCLVYIDLNMVRAGVVKHPAEWAHSGYREIQEPAERYAVIDLPRLIALCGFTEVADFQQAHRQWVGEALDGEMAVREDRWSKAIAVGSLDFVDKVRSELGVKAMHREVVQLDGTSTLREESDAYGSDFVSENDALTLDNTILWEENVEGTET
jgi:putative transposase